MSLLSWFFVAVSCGAFVMPFLAAHPGAEGAWDA